MDFFVNLLTGGAGIAGANKNILLLLMLLVFVSPTFADVRKWKDADGKTHYGDAPPLAGTEKIRRNHQTDAQAAENADRIRAETKKSVLEDEMVESRKVAVNSGKCTFQYYTLWDDKGELLAKAAKEECLNNEVLKKTGQGGKVSLEAYNTWKEHRQMTSSQRNAALDRAQGAQTQEQLRQIQNTQQQMERTQHEIQNRQRGIGY